MKDDNITVVKESISVYYRDILWLYDLDTNPDKTLLHYIDAWLGDLLFTLKTMIEQKNSAEFFLIMHSTMYLQRLATLADRLGKSEEGALVVNKMCKEYKRELEKNKELQTLVNSLATENINLRNIVEILEKEISKVSEIEKIVKELKQRKQEIN